MGLGEGGFKLLGEAECSHIPFNPTRLFPLTILQLEESEQSLSPLL